jgi:hypothetical protein
MEEPTFIACVTLIVNLFDRFIQECETELDWYSERFVYKHMTLIVFFMMMQQRRIVKCKAMWRWLKAHVPERQMLAGVTPIDNLDAVGKQVSP